MVLQCIEVIDNPGHCVHEILGVDVVIVNSTRYFGGDSDIEYLYSFSDILHISNYSTTVDITYPSALDALYSNPWIVYIWTVCNSLI